MITLTHYANKNIAVFGLGITGISVVNALVRSGANVYAWDDRNISKISGVNFVHPSKWDWKAMGALILSPGVPLKYPEPHEIVLMAQESGCRIACDIDLLYESQPQAKFIGITGTNGKSTTTSLIHHILQYNNINTCCGGNIGVAALDLRADAEVYVLEMSSYQLDLCESIKFDISILLNITPDHLDRHGNMENYIAAKKKIFSFQSTNIILIDNEINSQLSPKVDKRIELSAHTILNQGISLVNHKIYEDANYIMSISPNNIIDENVIASYAACSLFGITGHKIVEAISTFQGLPHRMESIKKIHNVNFINDSKATNAIAAQQALLKYHNIYWIAGGRAKEGGISGMNLSHVKKVFLIGESTKEFANTLQNVGKEYSECFTLEDAMKQAYEQALINRNDDNTVLLSPACSSFDQWKNFEERGKYFRDSVINGLN